MMCTVQVTAQYYENYSDMGGPYWKPKGGADFHFPLDADTALNIPPKVLVEALSKMVEAQSNGMARYEYLEHEIKFSSPIVVEGLDKELGKMFAR